MSLLLTLALAFAFISFFMLKAGIPGKLGSLEGMSIATHLQGIHSPLFGVAWGLFALAGVWVFVRMNPLPEGIARLVAFSYSGMLLIVFAPISFGISTLRYDPGAKLLVSGVISFVLAGLFCHALTGFQHTEVRQKRRMIGEAIPLLLVFVAGCLLYISRFG